MADVWNNRRPQLLSPQFHTAHPISPPNILNLQQIQSVVRDPKPEAQTRKVARKVNPLKNRSVMVSLNPHHEARVKAQAAYQEAQRAGRKAILKERRARKGEGKKFYQKANMEGDIKF